MSTIMLDERAKKFRTKKHRIRQIGNHGLSRKHAARAVGMLSISYAAELTGFSDSTLTTVRRDIAFAATLATSGGQFEHALLAIDGAKGRLDPAFYAHSLHIVTWARAIYEEWIDLQTIGRATRQLNTWHARLETTGPSSAALAPRRLPRHGASGGGLRPPRP